MKVSLIDVDAESRGKVTFPNVPLMKIAAYHKETAPKITRKLQRYVNSPMIFWSIGSFDEYQKNE